MWTWRARHARSCSRRPAAPRCRWPSWSRSSAEKPPPAGARHGGLPDQRSRDARRRRCCTASSTTRCCTSKNVILTVVTANVPRVADAERVRIERDRRHASRASTLTFGFMETPNVPRALALCRKLGWKFDIMSTSFFLSRRIDQRRRRISACRCGRTSCSSCWRATPATRPTIFHIPTGRVVEIGTQITV